LEFGISDLEYFNLWFLILDLRIILIRSIKSIKYIQGKNSKSEIPNSKLFQQDHLPSPLLREYKFQFLNPKFQIISE
jgi:hypothetical protein